jgi:hypothetical protein
VTSPPTTIVPLPVVIPKGRILVTPERLTAEVIINSPVASTIIGKVPCAVEVSVAINGHVIACTKLVSVSITINLNVFRAVRREVSLAIHLGIVSSTKLVGIPIPSNLRVPCPINR